MRITRLMDRMHSLRVGPGAKFHDWKYQSNISGLQGPATPPTGS